MMEFKLPVASHVYEKTRQYNLFIQLGLTIEFHSTQQVFTTCCTRNQVPKESKGYSTPKEFIEYWPGSR